MTKPLEYLDIEQKYVENKSTLDNIHYYCFADGKSFKHRFHSEDPQLKLLCDSTYCILNNIHACRQYGYYITDEFLDLSKKQNKKVEEINEKLEFLMQQQKVRHITNLPTIEDIHTLLTELQPLKKVNQEIVHLIKKVESKVQSLETLVTELVTLIKKNIGNE